MRTDPPIDHEQLRDCLRREYGIEPRALTFVPLGFDAACYRIEANDGTYFLKRWPSRPASTFAVSHAGRSLVLMQALDQRALVRVPAPICTRDGRLWAAFAGVPMALMPFVAGEPAPEDIDRPFQPLFGRTLARIHAATEGVRDLGLLREDFAYDNLDALSAPEPGLATANPRRRAGLRELDVFLNAHSEEIGHALDRLQRARVAAVAAARGQTRVLCHTDFGGANLLVNGDTVTVLDWDYAMLAPPECDLYLVAGEHWETVDDRARGVFDAYRAAGGTATLHLELFEFCLVRRALGDLAARVNRLLDPATSESDDEHLIDGLMRYGVGRLRTVDLVLDVIRDAIA